MDVLIENEKNYILKSKGVWLIYYIASKQHIPLRQLSYVWTCQGTLYSHFTGDEDWSDNVTQCDCIL